MEMVFLVIGLLSLVAWISVVVNVHKLSHNVAAITQMMVDDRENDVESSG